MRRRFFTVLALAFAAAGAAAAAIGVDAGGGYLAVWGGEVASEAGAVRTLGPFEFAFVSDGGAAFAVASLVEGAMPLKSAVRVYERSGRLLWAVADTAATSAYVADSGAAALVTMVGDGPSATARLDFYSAAGARTGGAEVGSPLVAAFFPGEDRLALTALGGPTTVYDVAAGVEKYELPAARTAAAGPEGRVLLVDRDWMALYRNGAELWRVRHDFYFPRLVSIDDAGTRAVIGGHHEVALVSLADGRVERRWEAPGDFAVTDLAAAADFSSFAVGMRTLAGAEAAVWLDAGFNVVKREERNVAQPSGSSPAVAVLGGTPRRVVALGQGWRTTLAR
ncbi:MAG TPA: hypothetical protein VMW93_03305 [bacterium]|nr:hypothetical protein [bacterium]